MKESLLLHQSLSLCRSLIPASQRFEVAFFEAVRVLMTKVTSENKSLSFNEINNQINELLKASIQSDGVLNLFSEVDQSFSLFDEQFIRDIADMQTHNLAVEILKKLLDEHISVCRKINLIEAEKFYEILYRLMKAYFNSMLSNEEVIANLVQMSKDMTQAHQEGATLGLTEEEIAFYDALIQPQAVQDFYKHEK